MRSYNKDEVLEKLESLSDEEILSLWNEYCDDFAEWLCNKWGYIYIKDSEEED